ncbi:hypothetical protein CYMTET_40353 [Cymbomonas tetramitiformis]|uniref:Uncharacterized protein n=1 Tax=Cymbomonas tetramitiformis TaxID=36881 RepID=A0AAE0F3L1_9CHLO|nr:hypothetical protein CYMTET_40353 [Cymbomonas tetramitiformis]
MGQSEGGVQWNAVMVVGSSSPSLSAQRPQMDLLRCIEEKLRTVTTEIREGVMLDLQGAVEGLTQQVSSLREQLEAAPRQSPTKQPQDVQVPSPVEPSLGQAELEKHTGSSQPSGLLTGASLATSNDAYTRHAAKSSDATTSAATESLQQQITQLTAALSEMQTGLGATMAAFQGMQLRMNHDVQGSAPPDMQVMREEMVRIRQETRDLQSAMDRRHGAPRALGAAMDTGQGVFANTLGVSKHLLRGASSDRHGENASPAERTLKGVPSSTLLHRSSNAQANDHSRLSTHAHCDATPPVHTKPPHHTDNWQSPSETPSVPGPPSVAKSSVIRRVEERTRRLHQLYQELSSLEQAGSDTSFSPQP